MVYYLDFFFKFVEGVRCSDVHLQFRGVRCPFVDSNLCPGIYYSETISDFSIYRKTPNLSASVNFFAKSPVNSVFYPEINFSKM